MSSPQGHVPEPHRGPAEGRVEGLARVRFPAEPRVEYLEVLPHRIDGAPERRGRQLDDRLPDRDRYLPVLEDGQDRKSTRLNSSHRTISYAVFCLKKKKYTQE